ncbi:ATP-dependent DNA helicase II subunit 1 [Pyricularia oryzae]|uniref:ATP-dependent DNA helicase II subunit 1 n=3 Tax=Pyricularia TaxID=48558 RepID=A0ABQ8N2D0_PYRGI|nr:ATP-dependent DNA helicase II subunit 1 [Pyricularia oryzae]KAI6290072.1 ATP-dependent DNA helicase II subunit 1 [Pyricularia grisea]KAH9438740.1 ATP-dependent DNA helicase II subunit 1 [Pyricularia oryzae]KAI6251837.1 ATP-dependent DNA helicase II subunit 1 [Pyricularia oryzae]KAI6264134.1 ATP-dependent DNA helicase II subunit 1 [Pyricularia oryzae]
MAADKYRQDVEDDVEADEEMDESDYKTQKDAIIFAIDVSKSMLEEPEHSSSKKADNDSPLTAALKCANQIMQQRIIASPKDMMGILLFNTERTKLRDVTSGGSYPHCYLYLDLDIPEAEDVKMLRSLVEEGEDLEGALVPSEEPATMANVLFCANQTFTTKAPNFGSRRLFIITDNDDPHSGDKAARASAAVRAKDLYDLGVIIELFSISKGDQKFDLAKFYDDIIYRDPTTEADEIKHAKSGDGLNLLSSLISNINSKQTPKRAYFSHLPFEVAPGLTISVKGYIPLHVQKPARTTWVHTAGEKAELALPETTKMEVSDSSRTVEKSEPKKAYKFGGDYIHLTPEETAQLKDWGGHVLRIIGFKPRSMIPQWASIKKSTYIFPAEEDHVGSTRVFSALWKKLLKDDKVGLAWFVARVNANPVLVAIIPSKRPSDEESGTKFLPAGLWLCTLPFADDLRETDKRDVIKAPEELTAKMRKVVGNLHLPKGTYDPARYPNPALQWHYKILQALALDEEVPEQGDDPTLPKFKAIAKRVGGAIAEINEDLEDAARVAQGQRALKREHEADDEDEKKPAKKSRIAVATSAKAGATTSDSQLRAAHQQDKLVKMTVADLKAILTSKGISPVGKKAELVEKLEQWIEGNL